MEYINFLLIFNFKFNEMIVIQKKRRSRTEISYKETA